MSKEKETRTFLEHQLTRTNDEFARARAKRNSNSVERAFRAKVDSIEGEIEEKQAEIDKMLDISTSNVSTTKNSIEDIGGERFVEKLTELDLDIELLNRELALVKSRRDELLAPVDAKGKRISSKESK